MASLPSYLEGFIDQFIVDKAVILRSDRTAIQIDRSSLPADAKPGDFVVQIDDAGHFRIDDEITEKRQRELRRQSDGYFG